MYEIEKTIIPLRVVVKIQKIYAKGSVVFPVCYLASFLRPELTSVMWVWQEACTKEVLYKYLLIDTWTCFHINCNSAWTGAAEEAPLE